MKIGEGKYRVEDGRHRFVFLKLLYLSELKKCNGEPDKIKELNEKFIIPATISNPIDYEATYCNYILHKIPTIDFETGKRLDGVSMNYVGINWNIEPGIYINYSNGKSVEKISREQFISFAKKGLIENKNVNFDIVNQYSETEGFRKFINSEIPEVASNLQNQKMMLDKIKGMVFEYDLKQNIFDKMEKLYFVKKGNALYGKLINKIGKIKEKIESGEMCEQELMEISNLIGNNKTQIIDASDKEFDRLYEEGIMEKVNLLIKQNKLDRIKEQNVQLIPLENQGLIVKLRKLYFE